jgi:hypothetical protein
MKRFIPDVVHCQGKTFFYEVPGDSGAHVAQTDHANSFHVSLLAALERTGIQPS